MTTPAIGRLVDDLFRRSSARIVAALTRTLGPQCLDLAEEVTQDALVRALELWPYQGVPVDPEGWLFRVAQNRARDQLRRTGRFNENVAPGATVDAGLWAGADHARVEAPLEAVEDDELKLIFLCCHPALNESAQVTLILKVASGFSVNEIAAAFLTKPTTIAQRLVRAKRTLRSSKPRFELPAPSELTGRLDAVLRAIYLTFNEGYSPHSGRQPIRDELCREAIRVCRLITENPFTAHAQAQALLSLFLLQGSRFGARRAVDGPGLLLWQQDRKGWNRGMIAEGLRHLDASTSTEELSTYHLEAGIAACHATAESAESTDWHRILDLYDLLAALRPTSVIRLNRAVAVGMVRGPEAGLEALVDLDEEPSLSRYYLLPSTRAAFHLRLGNASEALRGYRVALEQAGDAPDRSYLAMKIRECEALIG